jgi:glutamate dehydrogenase
MSTPEPVHNVNGGPSVPAQAAIRLSTLTNLHGGSEASLHRVKNQPGYTTPVFKGKDEQRALVENDVAEKVRMLSLVGALF